jgi:hypothetical protein
MEILNVWNSEPNKLKYYNQSNPIYTNGDYSIYKMGDRNYLYTYKNIAFNNLAGINKAHINSVADKLRPDSLPFLYDRAIETLEKGIKLLSHEKQTLDILD